MFDKLKANVAAKNSAKQHQEWEAAVTEARYLIGLADGSMQASVPGVAIASGEHVIGFIENAGLVELVRGQGHYVGRSQGVSIPIGSLGGRSVRYRVGASKGHFVQGTPSPQSVDRGRLVFTDRRVLFLGSQKSVECRFEKILSASHAPGEMTFGLSNRKNNVTISFGEGADRWVGLCYAIANARSRGEGQVLVDNFTEQLEQLLRQEPKDDI